MGGRRWRARLTQGHPHIVGGAALAAQPEGFQGLAAALQLFAGAGVEVPEGSLWPSVLLLHLKSPAAALEWGSHQHPVDPHELMDDDYRDDDYVSVDDDYLASGGVDDDYRGTNSLGFVDDDYSRRLGDDDYITGKRIRKRDLKDDDYSFLPSSARRLYRGGKRADDLLGRGRGVEVFIGRKKDDNFLLGDRNGDFYDDDYRKSGRKSGRRSYGVIKDFSFRQNDTIFLHGKPLNYRLSRIRIDGIRGVGIFRQDENGSNLIGVIQGKRPKRFDLDDSSTFRFFGG
jgi:hypothetical protein